MLSNILRFDLNHIADYLSYDDNQLQQILQHPKIASNEVQKSKLRSIILLSYKTKFIEMMQSLWKVYRQSGTDQLNLDSEIQLLDRQVWPQEVQLLLNELHPILFGTQAATFAPFTMRYPRNAYTYLKFIDSCYHALQKKHEDSETMLKVEIHRLPDYKVHFKELIDAFIQQQLLPKQIEVDCQIELIYHEFKDEIYRRQLATVILNDSQVGYSRRLIIYFSYLSVCLDI
jgi:hypothetical protein